MRRPPALRAVLAHADIRQSDDCAAMRGVVSQAGPCAAQHAGNPVLAWRGGRATKVAGQRDARCGGQSLSHGMSVPSYDVSIPSHCMWALRAICIVICSAPIRVQLRVAAVANTTVCTVCANMCARHGDNREDNHGDGQGGGMC